MHTGLNSIRRSRCRGHVVEVTFRSHYNAYDLFSNTTRLPSSIFNGRKIMLYSKHTQMTKKNSKGMSTSNVGKITFQGSPYNAYTFYLHTQVTLSKSRSETITMPMICSLIEHGFLPVFSTERKVMLYSNLLLLIMNTFNQNIKSTVMEMALHEILCQFQA